MSLPRSPFAAALLLAALLTPSALAAVSMPSVFGDHMVLQRESEVNLWGWDRPGTEITVTASWGATAQAVVAEDGRFTCKLATPEAGGPYSVEVKSPASTIQFKDVLIGEVWLCSGQSNMEWPLARAANAEAEIAAAGDDQLRFFNVPNRFAAPRRIDCEGSWTASTPATARSFSAVAQFFARELREALGVPVGLIEADWGGTKARAWMSEEALRPFGEFDDALDYLAAVQDPARRAEMVEKTDPNRWWQQLDRRVTGLQGWLGRDFDDSKWATATLPGGFAGDLASFDGVVYYRRAFELSEPWEGVAAKLALPPIDDFDDVWVNGKHVGGEHRPGYWGTARTYSIPADRLREGKNVVCVRVLDTAGPGGMTGTPEQLQITTEGQDPVALAGEWKMLKGRAMANIPAQNQQPQAKINQNTASALFNGMMSPVIPYSLKGFLWYQGESDRNDYELYRELFPALIRDWRAQWGEELPFYFVQIAPFNYRGDTGQAAMQREAQAMALRLPRTGMAVTMDIGNPRDIHPTNKQDVGKRLAAWALAKDYGQDIVYSGPLFRTAELEGDRLRVRFDHADGLELRKSTRSHFLVAGEDRVFRTANVKVDDDAVLVWHEAVSKPVAVRYGWEAASAPNLFGGTGLPAAPFRSDDWDDAKVLVDNRSDMEQWRTKEEGFVSLFNGTDLDGWVNVNCADSTWQVKDGVIWCSGFPTGLLRTEKQYRNFVLEMEFRHLEAGGNAGLFVWSDPVTARGQPFTRSVEVQVMDGREGSWYTSQGDIFPIHGAVMTPENSRGGSRAFPTEERMNPAPMWNHYRVTCVDGAISLAVNGKVVTRGSECSPRQGYICLESEGSPIEFANLRIKELPAEGELPPEQICDVASGFRPLYNGVDFTGWKFGEAHEGHWKATNWRLEATGQGSDLWTEEEFGDFELICDWRWSAEPTPRQRPVILPSGEVARDDDGKEKTIEVQDAGDSGIYLRGSSKSQVNIWCWPCGSGEVYGYRTDRNMPPEVRAGVTPSEVADAPLGQWNRFHITMKGEYLTVVLNGKTVLDNAHLPGVKPKGPIALQKHGAPIQFANLYIRELK